MEIKSKFNEGDLVFTKNSDKKTVTAFFICSIDSYRQQDGFVYKCVRADFLEMYKIDNKKINDIKYERFNIQPKTQMV